MSPRKCVALDCGRPARKRGLCQMHYKRFQRGDKPQVERLSEDPGPVVPEGLKTPILHAPEQGFVPNLSGLTQVQQSAVIGKGTKRYQIAGSTCSDCVDKPDSEWCYSDSHPSYRQHHEVLQRMPGGKPLEDFHRMGRAADGRRGTCKACRNAARRREQTGSSLAPVSEEPTSLDGSTSEDGETLIASLLRERNRLLKRAQAEGLRVVPLGIDRTLAVLGYWRAS